MGIMRPLRVLVLNPSNPVMDWKRKMSESDIVISHGVIVKARNGHPGTYIGQAVFVWDEVPLDPASEKKEPFDWEGFFGIWLGPRNEEVQGETP